MRLLVMTYLLVTSASWASPEADSRYAFKSLLAVVVNLDQEPVHGQHVQLEMEKFFRERPRFELSGPAYQAVRPDLSKAAIADLGSAKAEELAPLLAKARAAGADSVLFAQVQRVGEEYQLLFVGAVPEPAEILFQRAVPVSDRFALQSFGSATAEGLTAFVQSLPFDATVLNREGYRVVIDRGAPSFKQGTRVALFTLEKGDSGISLTETGVILLNRVDKNLSFGTILVENRPLEILKGNKVRFQSLGTLSSDSTVANLRPPILTRDVASTPEGTTANLVSQKERWGFIDAQLTGSFISWSRTASSSGAFRSDTGFYPGAQIRAQVKLTNNAFAELSGMFGIAQLGTTATGSNLSLSSQSNQIRAIAGYRLMLNRVGWAPSAFVRAGFSRTQFQVDELPNFLAPSSAVFTGVIIGGGFDFPFGETFGAGLEMNGLAFPSLSESGGTSGATVTTLSGWDFAVRGYYHFNEAVNLEAKMVFQTHTGGFTGQGTRPVALSSLSQTTRAFSTGISYYF